MGVERGSVTYGELALVISKDGTEPSVVRRRDGLIKIAKACNNWGGLALTRSSIDSALSFQGFSCKGNEGD